jgi:hypothetical protein
MVSTSLLICNFFEHFNHLDTPTSFIIYFIYVPISLLVSYTAKNIKSVISAVSVQLLSLIS